MIRLATTMRISNVWMLEHGGERFLVDTGYPIERPLLRRWLHACGVRKKGDLSGVILTHRHSDHAGNAAWLRHTYDAPIICHEADAKILDGRVPAPKLCGHHKQMPHEWFLSAFEDRYPARVKVDEELSEGRWREVFQVIHTPGHTEGSIMLRHLPTESLFSGDVIIAGYAPLRAIERLSLAMPGFSLAVDEAHATTRAFLRRLDEIEQVGTLCAGHGPIVTEQTVAKLRKLAG
ncbi:MAG: MBL fold metallo-hydrolase [Deltaproteobacteria bacterium]|nr:MBL fold metallo-hydrolase [Deltaproteobacteria bacterium]